MRIILLTLLTLLFVGTAHATTVYVKLGCANNGDGTTTDCAASPGGTGAYNKIETAVESNGTKDRVTATQPYIVECHVGTTDLEDLGGGTISNSGYTTSASYYLEIRSADPTNKCRVRTTAGSLAPFRYEASGGTHTNLRHIHWEHNASGANQAYGLRLNAVPVGLTMEIEGNIFEFIGTTTGRCYGLDLDSAQNSPNLKAWNNHIEGWNACDVSFEIGASLDCTSRTNCQIAFYNNTINNSGNIGLLLTRYAGDGIGNMYVKNNLICNSSGVDYSNGGGANVTLTTATNQTCDATSPDGASYQSVTATFATAGLPDVTGDPVDAGTDLSADAQIVVTDDYIGTARSAPFDIGAFETASSGINAAIYLRIRD